MTGARFERKDVDMCGNPIVATLTQNPDTGIYIGSIDYPDGERSVITCNTVAEFKAWAQEHGAEKIELAF